jgi:hypothetical protein
LGLIKPAFPQRQAFMSSAFHLCYRQSGRKAQEPTETDRAEHSRRNIKTGSFDPRRKQKRNGNLMAKTVTWVYGIACKVITMCSVINNSTEYYYDGVEVIPPHA